MLNGHLYAPQFFATGPQLLASEVEDGCRLDGLAEKWQVNGAALAAKCASLSPWQAYVIHHLARLFWAGPYRDSDISEVVSKLFHCAE